MRMALSIGMVLSAAACNSPSSQPSPSRTAMAEQSIYDFTLNAIDGKPVSLGSLQGKVLLVVNVASECGFTPQYAGLQRLHEQYADRGLVVLGIPSNDFGRQEPGTNQEIQTFCSSEFGVTFPLFEKVVVKGAGQHPLYNWLTSKGDSVGWNFNKFLIDRKGQLVKHYGARVEPESKELTSAIKALL